MNKDVNTVSTFNSLESFDKNGNVTIFIEHGINVARPKLIINEYWTQRCTTSECNWENRWKA